MNDKWNPGIWVVLILCLTLLIFIIFVIKTSPDIEKYKNVGLIIDPNDIFSDAENGDLILMSGNTYGEKVCKWFSNSIFSHVGFLFRENHPETKEDILYIWDADIGQKARDGPRVMKFEDKLTIYKGFRIGAWKKLIVSENRKRPSLKDILKIIPRYSNKEFDDLMMTWFIPLYMNTIHSIVNDNSKVFCSELIASTLQDLNILKENRRPTSYCPEDFFRSNINTDLEKGYTYSDPKFFKF